MYYLIGRDLDADGQYEFIQDMDNMILTEEPSRALQMTENELDYIDMEYLNAAGFYAMEADRFQVNLLEALFFRPPMRGYRPRIAPPPRRRPPRRRAASPLGILGALLHAAHRPAPRRAPAPRPPKPRARRAAPPPPPARPAPGPRAAAPARPAADRPAPGRRAASPARPAARPAPGAGRRTPGGRGPGGRGPGR